jgi:hypothetical protein
MLLGAGQRPYPLVSAIPHDNPREGAPRQKIHELSEKRLANVHGRLLGYLPRSARSRSNRHHAKAPENHRKSKCYGQAAVTQPDRCERGYELNRVVQRILDVKSERMLIRVEQGKGRR